MRDSWISMRLVKPLVIGVASVTCLLILSLYLLVVPRYPTTGQQLVTGGLQLAAAGLGVQAPVLNLTPEPLPIVTPWALRVLAGVPAVVAAVQGVRNAQP